MTTVTVAEARENLPDLLRRAAAGEQIVIADGGKWLAALGAPPPPPATADEIAAAEARTEEFVRLWREQAAREQRLPAPVSKAG